MARQPISAYRFNPAGPFMARRTFTLAGKQYRPGDPVPADAAPVRRMRQLYEWRWLDPAIAAEDTAQDTAEPAAGTDAPAEPEPAASDAPTGDDGEESAAPPADGDRYRAVHRGGGRWAVLDTRDDDKVVAGPMKRGDAVNDAARRNAEG